jgi:hypothetical protein
VGEAVVAIVVGVRLTTPSHPHHHNHHHFCCHLPLTPSPLTPVNSHHNHHNQTRPSSRRRRPSTPQNLSQSCGASAASDQKIQQKRRRGLQEWSRPSPTTRACKKKIYFQQPTPLLSFEGFSSERQQAQVGCRIAFSSFSQTRGCHTWYHLFLLSLTSLCGHCVRALHTCTAPTRSHLLSTPKNGSLLFLVVAPVHLGIWLAGNPMSNPRGLISLSAQPL